MSAHGKGYRDGLLDAQRLANEAVAAAAREGKTEVANALAALSTDLLLIREAHVAREAKGILR